MADEHPMFIAGEWVGSQSGATFEATSPSTGEVIGTLPEGTRDDVRQAVAAGDAFPIWSRLTAFDRARAMRRVAEAIDRRRDEMAHTLALDHGKPMRAEAIDEVEELIACFEMAAADAVRVEGRVGRRFSIERLTELKTIVVHLGWEGRACSGRRDDRPGSSSRLTCTAPSRRSGSSSARRRSTRPTRSCSAAT